MRNRKILHALRLSSILLTYGVTASNDSLPSNLCMRACSKDACESTEMKSVCITCSGPVGKECEEANNRSFAEDPGLKERIKSICKKKPFGVTGPAPTIGEMNTPLKEVCKAANS